MEYPKLLGINKSPHHNVFIIEKKKEFLEGFRIFMHNIGFMEYDTSRILLPLGDTDNNYTGKRYSSKRYQDKYFYFQNEIYKVEIFFGIKKVIISIFTQKDMQHKIAKELNKIFK